LVGKGTGDERDHRRRAGAKMSIEKGEKENIRREDDAPSLAGRGGPPVCA